MVYIKKSSTSKFDYVMEEFAEGKLKTQDGKVVTDKDQALAIAYSESGQTNKAYTIKKSEDYGCNAEGYSLQNKYEFAGLPIAIENKKGSVRKWYDSDSKETGSTPMYMDYGYIEGIKGADKEELDVYIGPDEVSPFIYAIHQNFPSTGEFDEDKMMLGFSTAESAKNAYLKQYDDPKFFGYIDEMKICDFVEKYIKGDGITSLPIHKPLQKSEEVLEAERTYTISVKPRFGKGEEISVHDCKFHVKGPRGSYSTFYCYAKQEAVSIFLTADCCATIGIDSPVGNRLEMLLGLDPSNPNVWIFHKHHPLTNEYLEDVLVMGSCCIEDALKIFCNRYKDSRYLNSAEHITIDKLKSSYYFTDQPIVLDKPMSGCHHYTAEYIKDTLRGLDPTDSKVYGME